MLLVAAGMAVAAVQAVVWYLRTVMKAVPVVEARRTYPQFGVKGNASALERLEQSIYA
ncbi:unnamed protein product [Gongylonema pulchrum]|uniref:ABC transmembrane type-1 domain-containing protein n=1 Tax=Gongylonema pulchrum TaxID=637853 RepID=A0A183EFK4_9BILA|nr:unnamed protein product [Gongylonema pulchrum]